MRHLSQLNMSSTSATPEDVIRAAYQAVAVGDAAALVAVTATRTLIRDADQRGIHLEPRRIEKFVAEALGRLPSSRQDLGCAVIGHVLETDNVAHVLFRVHWQGKPEPNRLISVATLHGEPEGWRLVLNPLSDWLVPGFENVLVSESFG